MDRHVAEAALREIERRATHKKTVILGFFGGEPTNHFEPVRLAVEQIAQWASRNSRSCVFHIRTNGVMAEAKLRFLIRNGFTVGVSVDGPPDIQDRQRPLRDGSPSSAHVEQSLLALENANADMYARVTVTDWSVSAMIEILDYLWGFGIRKVYMEPAQISRDGMRFRRDPPASRRFTARPEIGMFVDCFSAALDFARQKGMALGNSSYANLLDPRAVPCSVQQGNHFVVTPSGQVSMCLAIQDPRHPLAGDFIVGSYSKESDTFAVDEALQRDLVRKHSVEARTECSECFAKYSCGGGCPNERLSSGWDGVTPDDYFCRIKRAILKEVILRTAKESELTLRV